jgi:hypothetical protein
MKIDRAAFLAITATLAVGCAASSGENAASDESAVTAPISAGGGQYCYGADEGTSGPAKDYWIGQIGFDPMNDFSAAEGFCFDAASTGKNDAQGFPEFDSYVYMKCNAYAKVYVTQVAYEAYANLKKNLKKGMAVSKKWEVLYDLDKSIAAEDFFCQTTADRILCRNAPDNGACLRASTQMNEDAKEKLQVCMEKWDVYTCIEGAAHDLRP